MALCPVVALDFLLCRLTQINRANIHLVLGILGLGLGLAASMISQMPGGRELLYAQGFPWEDIVFFIAVCSLCESKNDYVWDNRGQFEEKERRAAAIKVQAERYARRRPLADVLSSGLGIFCTMLALLALVAWLFGLLGWPRLAPSFLAMAGPLWLGLHLGWHRHAPEQVSDVVFILYPQAWYPADVDAVVKRMGNLGHHPFASTTSEVWLARILVRGRLLEKVNIKVKDQNTRNPLMVICRDYNDCSISASFESILKGYNDPRLVKMALPVGWMDKGDIKDQSGKETNSIGKIYGVRNGFEVPAAGEYKMYSIPMVNTDGKDPMSTD